MHTADTDDWRPDEPPEEADDTPDTPPTEPPPVPVRDPKPEGQPPGPYIASKASPQTGELAEPVVRCASLAPTLALPGFAGRLP
jgi:hypothetical protein